MTVAPDDLAPSVDCHAHIFTRDMPLSGAAWRHPKGEATVEQYLEVLNRAGVARAVLAAASIYGDYNNYSLAATRGNPNLKTTVIVSPDVDVDDLKQMKRDGAVGVRFQWRNVADLPDLSSPSYRRLLQRVADLDWHIELHDDAHRLPPAIAAIEGAGVKLVIDHFGRPGPEGLRSLGMDAVFAAVGRGRTWVKLSAGFRLPSPVVAAEVGAEFLRTAGPARLLWGSDWPFVGFEGETDYDRELATWRALIVDVSTRQALNQTAEAFYF